MTTPPRGSHKWRGPSRGRPPLQFSPSGASLEAPRLPSLAPFQRPPPSPAASSLASSRQSPSLAFNAPHSLMQQSLYDPHFMSLMLLCFNISHSSCVQKTQSGPIVIKAPGVVEDRRWSSGMD
ncbi:hypothetical protein M758_6G040400 [Ceratodon purpureus]|nr:hypothetical protein M758_6G040400 [Ceratodon purpureus]